MKRAIAIAAVAAALPGLAGCAGTWDTVSSRNFRKAPFDTTYRMIVPEDPMVVLRADPPRDGDERAKAMRRLKEPIAAGLGQQDQDQMLDLLARTATADNSPVLRIAAIEALGRFSDPRAAGALQVAYMKAHGRADGTPDPLSADAGIQLAGAGGRSMSRASLVPLSGPVGFAPDVVEAVRCRALESLGRTSHPDAVPFLSAVAAGPVSPQSPEGCEDREVRLAAVRGLTSCRHPESVVALTKVLSAERGKDSALTGRAHDGLINLTGKRLPADPKQWDEVVQAGATIAPEPSWVENAFDWTRR